MRLPWRARVGNISRFGDVISCCQRTNGKTASFGKKTSAPRRAINDRKRCVRPRRKHIASTSKYTTPTSGCQASSRTFSVRRRRGAGEAPLRLGELWAHTLPLRHARRQRGTLRSLARRAVRTAVGVRRVPRLRLRPPSVAAPSGRPATDDQRSTPPHFLIFPPKSTWPQGRGTRLNILSAEPIRPFCQAK